MATVQRDTQAVGSDKGHDVSEHLEELQAIAPRQQLRELAPMQRMPNGSRRSMAKDVELASYRSEATKRMREAGVCLREWLVNSDDADLWNRWSQLTPGDKEALERATSLRSLEATIVRRVREHDRNAEAARRASMKRVRYPSVSRRSFDMLDREPASPGGVVMEG